MTRMLVVVIVNGVTGHDMQREREIPRQILYIDTDRVKALSLEATGLG